MPRAHRLLFARFTVGFSRSSGRLVIPSIRFSTRVITSLISSFGSISKLIRARSRLASERIFLMPCKPSRADSMGKITPFSTSTGAAPGYGAVTLIIRISVRGNISLLILVSASAPAQKVRIITRLAATGFRVNQPISPPVSSSLNGQLPYRRCFSPLT